MCRRSFQKLYDVYHPQQQFLKINAPACAVILAEYSKFLGDVAQYQKTLEIDQNNLEHELAAYYIVLPGELLYNKAWDCHELDKETCKVRKPPGNSFAPSGLQNFAKMRCLLIFLSKEQKKYLN